VIARKPISRADRFSVWDVWGGCCYWCGKPIEFADCEIDHVISLNAVKKRHPGTYDTIFIVRRLRFRLV
jgi:hypothetical protein